MALPGATAGWDPRHSAAGPTAAPFCTCRAPWVKKNEDPPPPRVHLLLRTAQRAQEAVVFVVSVLVPLGVSRRCL